MEAGKRTGRPTALVGSSAQPGAQPRDNLLHQPEPNDSEAHPHILQRSHSTGKPKLDSYISQALQLTLLNVAKWRECK